MRRRRSLGHAVISTIGNEWLRLQPFLGSISLPRIIGTPLLGTAALAGEGFLALNAALAGEHMGVARYGKPGEFLYEFYPLYQEFGEMGMMLYNILVLCSMAKELYVDVPYSCFSSMSNYVLSQQLQDGKFKPLNQNAGFFERTKVMVHNPSAMVIGGLPALLAVSSGGFPAFLIMSFLLSKGFDYSTYARQRSNEWDNYNDLRRALNTVGQARIPENIRAELTETMLGVVKSGNGRASMQKYLIALFAAKSFEAVNDNLAIDIAKGVARTGGGAVDVSNAADTALAQSAVRHRGNTGAYIAEAAQILRNHGVNYTEDDAADTQRFVEVVRQRQAYQGRNR